MFWDYEYSSLWTAFNTCNPKVHDCIGKTISDYGMILKYHILHRCSSCYVQNGTGGDVTIIFCAMRKSPNTIGNSCVSCKSPNRTDYD